MAHQGQLIASTAAGALALLCAGCAGSKPEAAVAPELSPPEPVVSTVVELPPPPAVGERAFLWDVRCPNQPGQAVLLGSIHVRRPEDLTLQPEVQAAVDDADRVLIEAQDPGLLGSLAVLYRLGAVRFFKKTELDPKTWDLLMPRLAELQIDRTVADHLAPWALLLVVMASDIERAGLSAATGIDALVQARAKEASPPIPIEYMESAEGQLKIFAALEEEVQEDLLTASLEAGSEASEVSLLDAYRAGDVTSMEAMTLEAFVDFPDLRKALLDDRNLHFVSFFRPYLDSSQTVLLVAGAAHMLGETGLPTLLRADGCKVDLRYPPASDTSLGEASP